MQVMTRLFATSAMTLLICLAGGGAQARMLSSAPSHAPEGTPPESVLCGYHADDIASVEFYMLANTQAQAVELAALIDAGRFDIEARESTLWSGWIVTARFRQLPRASELEAQSEVTESLAQRVNAEFRRHRCRTHSYRR